VIVRRNRAEEKCRRIEIENTTGATSTRNGTGNTGGILVFNMPNLEQPGHSDARLQNTSIDNNLAISPPRRGGGQRPAGSGVVVNSIQGWKFFDNDLAGIRRQT